MTMSAGKRADFWDVLRGIAMLIVVFGHSLQVCNGGDPTNPLHLVIRCFQMELLFFISGYVSGWSRPGSLGGALWSRFLRLGVPYLAWVVLFYLLHIVLVRDQFAVGTFLLDLACSGFWFLRVLLIISVFHCLWSRMCCRYAKFLSAIGIFGLSAWLSSFPGEEYLFRFVIAFAAGVLAHETNILKFVDRISCNCPFLKWVGRNSLAIYAVHWNVLFCHFPSWRLGLGRIIDNQDTSLIYMRASVVCLCWLIYTCGFILLAKRIYLFPQIFFGERFQGGSVQSAGKNR